MDLYKVAEEIRIILSKRQKELQLTFEEDTHKYTMLDLDGKLHSNFPSVSKVMKLFYDEFPTEKKASEMSGGDPDETEKLLAEWAEKGTRSTNMGSRVHYFLEDHTLKEFNVIKKSKTEDEIKAMISKMAGIDLEEDEVIEFSFEEPKKKSRSKLKTMAELYPEAALTPEEKEQIKRDVKEDLELKKKDRTAWENKHGYKPGQEKELDKYNEIYALMSVY